MTTNPPDAEGTPEEEAVTAEEAEAATDPLAEFAASVAETLGADSWTAEHETVKVRVAADRWYDSVETARDAIGLPFFEFLSAIHWSNDVEVGDPPDDEVDERIEVLCALGDVVEGRLVILSTDLDADDPRLASVEPLYVGAQWHEREATEMFGITFEGLTHTGHLYLPDHFEGHPLRKSFALLSREVKPWPGEVDVEDMPEAAPSGPSTENPGA